MLTFAKLYKTSNYVIPAPISSAGGGYGRACSPNRPKHGTFGERPNNLKVTRGYATRPTMNITAAFTHSALSPPQNSNCRVDEAERIHHVGGGLSSRATLHQCPPLAEVSRSDGGGYFFLDFHS